LVLSLENSTPDNLKILDLVKSSGEKNNTFNTSSTPNENVNTKANNMDEKLDPSNGNKLINDSMSPNANLLNSGNLVSPLNMITNAGCTTTVLAVSGISSNLLMSSGALGMSQIANFNTIAHTNNNLINGKLSIVNTMPNFKQDLNQSQNLNSDYPNGLNGTYNGTMIKQMKTLDFCYLDENKFTIIDAINLCVTIVAYASNANRASQMLVILDVLIPRYLNHIKNETDKIQVNNKSPRFKLKKQNAAPVNETTIQARIELASIQKIAISIKNLIHASDFLMRNYKLDKNEKYESAKTTNPNKYEPSASMLRSSNRSPSILPDEESK
jgi:hypothetical protein